MYSSDALSEEYEKYTSLQNISICEAAVKSSMLGRCYYYYIFMAERALLYERQPRRLR